MVDSGKKKTLINRLLFALKPKRTSDIVAYAESIIDDYTGLSQLRERRKARKKKRIALIMSVTAFTSIIFWCFYKIFF